MRLSANLVLNYANVNQFGFQDQWQVRAGDPNTLYFQLIDLDQASGANGCECYLRYLLGISIQNQPYGVTVTFPSIDDSKIITATAVQVDPNDSSLWSVKILSSQQPGSGNVIFTVTEGSTTRTFKVMNALAVEYPGNDGCC